MIVSMMQTGENLICGPFSVMDLGSLLQMS